VYLLSAVATVGATAQQGFTSTNALIDVVNTCTRTYKKMRTPCIRFCRLMQFAFYTPSEINSQKSNSSLSFLSSPAICVRRTTCAIHMQQRPSSAYCSSSAGHPYSSTKKTSESAHLKSFTLMSKIEAGGTPEKIAANVF